MSGQTPWQGSRRVTCSSDVTSLRLYVTGGGPNSVAALANLRQICASLPDGKCQVEVVDVLQNPGRLLLDGVVVTPMLVKFSPLPVRRVVGSLDNHQQVLQALGLEG